MFCAFRAMFGILESTSLAGVKWISDNAWVRVAAKRKEINYQPADL